MKKLEFRLITLFFAGSFVMSGCYRVAGVKGEIERNCTGVYLKIEDTFLRICNTASVVAYADGALVKASYTDADQCSADGDIVCAMYFPNDGRIDIKKVDYR